MVQETYKTTWLAKAPEHWNTLRIKNIFAEIDDRSETGQEELLSVSHYTGVTKKRDSLENETDFISNAKTLVGYKKVAENDLVSNIMLAWNGSLGISKYNGITSPAYCVYRIKGDNNPNYFGYLFSTAFMKAEFRKKSFGIIDSRLRLYSDKFFSIPVPVPPKTEQDQIVTYIKAQSKKIKHFIKKKQTFIELLKEQRQAVINKAVTKGINPNTKLKDSGIDWLGDIPEHWEVRRLKFIAKINNGIDCEKDKGGNIPVYGSGGIFGWTEKPIYDKPSVLLGRKGTIDKPQLVEEPFWTVDTAFWTIINPEISTPIYFYYLCCQIRFEYYSSKTALPSMTQTDLYQVKFAVPPLSEQAQIVSHIKTETAKIDQAIAKAQKEIELIKEYKEAMIAEAVLGKFNHKIVKS